MVVITLIVLIIVILRKYLDEFSHAMIILCSLKCMTSPIRMHLCNISRSNIFPLNLQISVSSRHFFYKFQLTIDIRSISKKSFVSIVLKC